jgi:hypothetical protein
MNNNEQLAIRGRTTKSGGKARKSAALALVCLLLLSVFSGCENIFTSSGNGSHAKKGFGKVSVTLTDGAPMAAPLAANMGRTAFPSTDFTRCEYTFTKVGETGGIEKTPNGEGFFTLEAGSYTVEVRAYIDNGGVEVLAATGTSRAFNVSPGSDISVTVTLSPPASTGTGTFSYAVTGPEGAVISVSLQKWPSDGTAVHLEPATEGNTVSQTLQLDDGIYLLTVMASKEGRYAGTVEIAHIYPSLETVYEKTFADGDLIAADTVSIDAIAVAAPVKDETPVSAVTETEEYTGTVTWSPAVSETFAPDTPYTATIILTAKEGYTLYGVAEDFFKVEGATARNAANSGIITAVFPVTAANSGISLSRTEDYIFPPATVGYDAREPLTVTVTNTGGKATGSLAVGLSGDNSGSFTLSTTSIASLAVAAADTFTVAPNDGLAAGTYTAAVTVSGGSGIAAQTFGLSFTVYAQGTASSIGLSWSGSTYTFAVADPGYAAAPTITASVYNSGQQATGDLTVSLSGANPGSFTLSKTLIESLAASSYNEETGVSTPPGQDRFTVSPQTGLPVGTYTATVTVSGDGVTARSFNVSFRVTSDPVYAIRLGMTGTNMLGSYQYGSDFVIQPRNVSVSNIGNQPTGDLAVSLSGPGADGFTLSATTIASIAKGGPVSTFTIAPKTGLNAGTHTATVTVSGGSGASAVSAEFGVSFQVNPNYMFTVTIEPIPDQTYNGGIAIQPEITVKDGSTTLTKDTDYTVSYTNNTNVTESYNPARVIVTGIGNYAGQRQATFNINRKVITFAIDPIFDIDYTGSAIRPVLTVRDGSTTLTLDTDYYVNYSSNVNPGTATANVYGMGNYEGSSGSVNFTIVAPPPTYGIRLSDYYGTGMDTITFRAEDYTYSSASSNSVYVANTGNQATGPLTIGLSGIDAGSFMLSATSISSITVGDYNRRNFTVQPKTGLNVGTYTATVTVSGDNGISAAVNVSFTVNPRVLSFIIETIPEQIYNGTPIEPTFTFRSSEYNLLKPGTDYIVEYSNNIEVGTYTAKVTVTGIGNYAGSSGSQTFTIGTKSIRLDKTGIIFPSRGPGYGAETSVFIENTGSLYTGPLTATLSGANPEYFILGRKEGETSVTIPSISGYTNFFVGAKVISVPGTYTATVTLTGTNISASIDLSFTIDPASYTISLYKDTIVIPAQKVGYIDLYDRLEGRNAVYNTGNQPAGDLIVSLSGADASSFTLNNTTLSFLYSSADLSYTPYGDAGVRAVTGLAVGTYNATVTISAASDNPNKDEITPQSYSVSFRVLGSIDYGISLSAAGTHTFDAAQVGYGTAPAALSVTVANLGNNATGALTAALSGANPGSFELSKTSISSINESGTDTFTVRPKTGLAAAEVPYTATVTVSGGSSISETFNVSFTVNTVPVSLSATGTYAFAPAIAGYAAPAPLTVTVTNGSTQVATGALTAALSGANPGSFELSKTSIASISASGSGSGTDTFTVVPKTGLSAGTHTATVTVSGANITSSQTFNVSFAVETATYGISLSETGTHSFAEADYGYSAAPSAKQVTVTNTGNQQTGALTAALSGTNPGSFTLSATSITSITAGSTRNFTVRPITGLGMGTHTATVTVSGTNVTSQTFSVSFTVNRNANAPYIITGSGNQFTATQSGGTIGTANQTIANVLAAIRTQASGAACTIQFGDGSSTLDIGSSGAAFNNTGGTWGAITLTGKITSKSPITVAGNISVTSTADIENTGYGSVVTHNSTGTFTISGGTVQMTSGSNSNSNYSVCNSSTGSIIISGGTVGNTSSSFSGGLVCNSSTGSIIISGGTHQSANSNGVTNESTGTVSISGGTIKTDRYVVNATGSGKITVSQDTGTTLLERTGTGSGNAINLIDTQTGTATRLEIKGGTVTTTATGTSVYNNTVGGVMISGGTLSSVTNSSSGTVNITNGTLSSVTNSSGTVNITNSTLSGSVTNLSSGSVNITNVTISGGVSNTSTGTVYIYSGTLSSVSNASSGTVIISGGTIQSTGTAVTNNGTGKITVSGSSTKITSSSAASNTITLGGTDIGTATQLEITGGTVSNTGGGRAIYHNSTGTLIISGGTVSSTTGQAVALASSGKLTVSQASGTTLITSANANVTGSNSSTLTSTGTIYIPPGTGLRFEMTGGTVTNTSTGNGVAIMVNSANGNGIVASITGGTITKTNGTGSTNNTATNIALYINMYSTATVDSGVTINGGSVNAGR